MSVSFTVISLVHGTEMKSNWLENEGTIWLLCKKKKKKNLVNFKDLTSFIQQFMNQAESNLEIQRSSEELYKTKDFF